MRYRSHQVGWEPRPERIEGSCKIMAFPFFRHETAGGYQHGVKLGFVVVKLPSRCRFAV